MEYNVDLTSEFIKANQLIKANEINNPSRPLTPVYIYETKEELTLNDDHINELFIFRNQDKLIFKAIQSGDTILLEQFRILRRPIEEI
ncbi:hypothetical protein H1230_30000 [Paenibacillus sp. 19GGS1-52]|uniref:hypothetical protein n=1 Tax=Paenibacillus sp. 19GGS1-52 TaxID=2758563 RepID=UPI001EFA93C1|nr:hypothetical protein [Paenibacillus sp. 19GGS1-52]ULO07123.1 hypothetical protein H1230_30000 [Paenibacillus sp. 19GGS1-52]